nr:phage protease [Pseudomonas aeruginosa]
MINSAIQEGRLIPSMEPWAREYGAKDLAGLKKLPGPGQAHRRPDPTAERRAYLGAYLGGPAGRGRPRGLLGHCRSSRRITSRP